MCVQVTEDDVDKVQQEYRGGEEERQDVLKYYERFKGDMSKVGLAGYRLASGQFRLSL